MSCYFVEQLTSMEEKIFIQFTCNTKHKQYYLIKQRTKNNNRIELSMFVYTTMMAKERWAYVIREWEPILSSCVFISFFHFISFRFCLFLCCWASIWSLLRNKSIALCLLRLPKTERLNVFCCILCCVFFYFSFVFFCVRMSFAPVVIDTRSKLCIRHLFFSQYPTLKTFALNLLCMWWVFPSNFPNFILYSDFVVKRE